ncbi:MAG: DnaJ domain-containing protein [Yoonia sp.]|nr:DnaJ domain-containing protein [Yoonia sp.]
MVQEDFYKTLGVARDASSDDIKRAYRKLARKYHPDVNTGADTAARFQAIGHAHDVLRDPEKRAAYDKFGPEWETLKQQQQQEQTRWTGGYGFAPEDMSQADAGIFEDYFSAFRQDPFGRRASTRPMDQHARIDIALEDIFTGATKTFGLQVPDLDDQGRVVWRDQRIAVNIPKGIAAGQHLRLKGKGGQGADLILEVALAPHPTFRVDGRDISVALPVTPWEAALGAKVGMPTPGGKVQITVPPNARSGQRLRLKGRGLPGPHAGDLYAELQIINPPVNTAEARAFYERMAKELNFDPRKDQGGGQ